MTESTRDGNAAASGLAITVVRRGRLLRSGSLDPDLRRDIEEFFLSLDQELEFLRTRTQDAWRAEVLLLARQRGDLAGMMGVVRRFCGVPCTFVVIKKEYQRRGIARALYEARRPHCRRYGAVFSIVLAGNGPGREFFLKAGEEMITDDGQRVFFVASQKRLFRLLFPLLRRLLPPLLKRFPRRRGVD